MHSKGFLAFAFAILVAFQLLLSAPAHAYSYTPQSNELVDPFRWPRVVKGWDLGVEAIGHFGKSNSPYSPTAGIAINAGAHIWYQHIVEAHAGVGLGVSSSFFYAKAGFKLNLLELVEDPEGDTIYRGVQRGLLKHIIQNFMIYVGGDLYYFSFPLNAGDPPGAYQTSGFAVAPKAGVQWYFNLSFVSWAEKFYVDTQVGYTHFSQNQWLMPSIGFGVELK